MSVDPLDQEDLLGEEMATNSSILAWRIPWTEQPGRLQSMGLERVGHGLATEHAVSVPAAYEVTVSGQPTHADLEFSECCFLLFIDGGFCPGSNMYVWCHRQPGLTSSWQTSKNLS